MHLDPSAAGNLMVYGDFAVWFCCPMAVLTPDEVKALLACDAKFDWTDLSPEKVQQQVDKLNACLSLQAVYSIYQKPGDFVSIPLGVMHAVSIDYLLPFFQIEKKRMAVCKLLPNSHSWNKAKDYVYLNFWLVACVNNLYKC